MVPVFGREIINLLTVLRTDYSFAKPVKTGLFYFLTPGFVPAGMQLLFVYYT
jgi:hypothetical protein